MNAAELDRLHRERPRSFVVRASIVGAIALAAYAWLGGDIALDDLFTARRLENLHRFLTVDVRPYALRGQPFSWHAHLDWAAKLMNERGWSGLLATLAISVLAICLAGAGGALAATVAARTVVTRRPFEPLSSARAESPVLRGIVALARAALIFLRAIPEYVWAFLFLAMLGPSAWPAVLALAIHNTGILGKLGAETIENLPHRPLAALRAGGASRAQVLVTAALPLALGRYLAFFFYRFETCVREATVLGMLGVVSLGYWIQDARSKQYYDEMLLFVAAGALVVLAADLVSAAVRALLRRAS